MSLNNYKSQTEINSDVGYAFLLSFNDLFFRRDVLKEEQAVKCSIWPTVTTCTEKSFHIY